jgi:DNA gyrase/topoisomerase IV subunit B
MSEQLENDIKLLKYPENVRTRPGMYIGSTENPNVILREIVDNSIDELLLPNGTDTIKISINQETGECIVGDNGRGIPNVIDEELGISKLEMAMGYLHAGGKFSKGKSASIGMNGIGCKATVATSSEFEVWSNGLHIKWEKGIKVLEDNSTELPEGFEGLSTVSRFIPDSEIFYGTIVPELDVDSLKYVRLICKELNKPEVHFIINGEEFQDTLTLPKYNVSYKSVFVDIEGNRYPYYESIYFDWELGRTSSNFDGTVNGVHTSRGVHIDWNLNHLKIRVAKNLGIKDKELLNLGLNMFVVVIASEVSFSSQTKERLTDIIGFNSDDCLPVYLSGIDWIMKSDKEFFDKLKKSCDIYVDSVNRAKEVREINNLLQGTMSNVPQHKDRTKSKLSATSVMDCSTTNRKDAELYICEGKSAMGTLVKARNPKIHSILPLRGKPLSAFNCGYDEMLRNREWLNLVLTIGGGIDKLCNVNKVRYGKIIIAADSDMDGYAIAISLLGSIATHMRYLIDNGLVYVLEVPLYQDTRTNTYYYAGEESKVDFGSGKIRRFKGLGEFTALQFRDIAFNTEKRKLTQVTPEDLDSAVYLIRETQPKKELMIETGNLSTSMITKDKFDSIKLRLS